MTRSARYKIHPAIGVARVGNAPESEFFLGPERPNEPSTGSVDAGTVVPPFKAGGQIKRQAARFRVWEYLDNDGVWTPSREVTGLDDDVVDLTWVVHLANRKAAFFKLMGEDVDDDDADAAAPAAADAASATDAPAAVKKKKHKKAASDDAPIRSVQFSSFIIQ